MRADGDDVIQRAVVRRDLTGGERPVSVVALVRGTAERAAIREACRGLATVEFCERAEELVHLAARSAARLVVAEPRDHDGVRTAPSLWVLRLRRPRIHVVSHLALTADDVRDAAAAWGMTVVIREHHDIRAMLRSVLSGDVSEATPGELLAIAAAHVPRGVRRFFTYCAWHAHQVRTASAAAQGADIPYRTLARRLHLTGLPPPPVVLTWYRLLHAAWHMELGAPKRDVVARAVGFRSGAALTQALRQHARMSWTELRDRVGLAGLLARFDAAMRISPADARDK